MKNTDFINIHTHKRSKHIKEFSILNTFIADIDNHLSLGEQCLSIGIHPWYINADDLLSDIKCMNNAMSEKKIIAVGEIGLDRFSKVNLDLQKKCFVNQVNIANRCNVPIIIHCVRCFYDIIEIKKKMKTNIPWIIHAYVGNRNITRELLKHGFYFSFGNYIHKALDCNNNSIGSENSDKTYNANICFALDNIPIERVFLETDDDDVGIECVYTYYSRYKNISVDVLITKIKNNFLKCFEVYDR